MLEIWVQYLHQSNDLMPKILFVWCYIKTGILIVVVSFKNIHYVVFNAFISGVPGIPWLSHGNWNMEFRLGQENW